MSLGGSSDPRATPASPPSRSSAISFSSRTFSSRREDSATAVATSASRRGVMARAGSLTRSRASPTARATRAPRRRPSATSRRSVSGTTTMTRRSRDGAEELLYSLNS